MTEKTKITGEVMAFSNPFSYQPSLNDIIMVRTELGFICVPVRDLRKYQIHQELEISIAIKSREKSLKDA
jgi:hypothetical protein